MYYSDVGHMTKMAATSIYVNKTLFFFLRNQWTDFHDTWYALGTRVHHILFK